MGNVNEVIEETLSTYLPSIPFGTPLDTVMSDINEGLKLNSNEGKCSASRELYESGVMEDKLIEAAKFIQAHALVDEGKLTLEELKEIEDNTSAPVLNIFRSRKMRSSCKGLVSILNEINENIKPKGQPLCRCDYDKVIRIKGCQCGGK